MKKIKKGERFITVQVPAVVHIRVRASDKVEAFDLARGILGGGSPCSATLKHQGGPMPINVRLAK